MVGKEAKSLEDVQEAAAANSADEGEDEVVSEDEDLEADNDVASKKYVLTFIGLLETLNKELQR